MPKQDTAPNAAMQERNAFDVAKDACLRPIKRDRSLPRNAFSVADEIARWFNRKGFHATGELIAWPSIPTIMDGTGLSRCTVMRMVEALAKAGYLAIEHGRGRRKFNRYRATEPAAENVSNVRPFRAPENVSNRSVKRLKPAAENVSNVRPDLLKGPSEPIGLSKQESPYRRERETREGSRSSPPAAARAPDGDGAAGSGRASKTDAAEASDFAELHRIWTPRRTAWPDNDDAQARREFAKARRTADADEIIAGAMETVRRIDAPRFLKALPVWLKARGWETPPPQKRARAQGGRSGGQHRSRRSRGEEGFEIALRMDGYVAQPDGTMARELPDGFRRIWGGVQ